MSNTASVMGLHFRYRLWIAEMNLHINIMRIFDDYIAALNSKKNEPDVKKGIEKFRQQFIQIRKEIDEQRHEMHLAKMALAAYDRQLMTNEKKAFPKAEHTELKKRYSVYKKNFDKVKKEFGQFEGQWLK